MDGAPTSRRRQPADRPGFIRSTGLPDSQRTVRLRGPQPPKPNYYYEIVVRNEPLPAWWPSESRWPEVMSSVDVTKERMTRIFTDEYEPYRFINFRQYHRTPRALAFDKNDHEMFAVWLTARRAILRRVTFGSGAQMRGLDGQEWKRVNNLQVVDSRVEEYLRALGLDEAVATLQQPEAAEVEQRAPVENLRAIVATDLDAGGDEVVDDELFSTDMPAAPRAPARNGKLGLDLDDTNLKNDYEEEGITAISSESVEGTATYLATTPDAGSTAASRPPRVELQHRSARVDVAAQTWGFPWVTENHQFKFARIMSRLAAPGLDFDGHPLPAFDEKGAWLTDDLRKYIVWEVQEMEFRNGLYTLDFVISQRTRTAARTERTVLRPVSIGAHREAELRACWGGGDLKPDEDKPSPLSLRDETEELLAALQAMFQLMLGWPRSHEFLREMQGGWSMQNMHHLEDMVSRCYVQTYFDFMRRAAPLPFIRPPLPWK